MSTNKYAYSAEKFRLISRRMGSSVLGATEGDTVKRVCRSLLATMGFLCIFAIVLLVAKLAGYYLTEMPQGMLPTSRCPSFIQDLLPAIPGS
jgi:hypothetical protein